MPQVVSVKTVNQRGRVAPNSKPLQRAKIAAQETGSNKKSLASKARKLAAPKDKPLGKNVVKNAKTGAPLGKKVTTISTHVTAGTAANNKPPGVTNKRTGAAMPTASVKRPRNAELFSSGNFFSVHGLDGNRVQTGNRSHSNSQFRLDAPCVGENGEIYFSNASAKTPEWCVEATVAAYIYAMMRVVDLAARKHVFGPGLCYLPLSVAVEMMKTTVLGSFNQMNTICESIKKNKIDNAIKTVEATETTDNDFTAGEIGLFEKTEFFRAFAHCDVQRVVKRVANRHDMKPFLRHSPYNKDDPFIPFWATDEYFDVSAWNAFLKNFTKQGENTSNEITIKSFTEAKVADTAGADFIGKMRALYSPLTPKFLHELASSITKEGVTDNTHKLEVKKEKWEKAEVNSAIEADYFATITGGTSDFQSMQREHVSLIPSAVNSKQYYNQAPSREDLRYSVAIALSHVHEMSFKTILSFIMKTAYNLKSAYKSDKPNPDIRSVLANAATFKLYDLILKHETQPSRFPEKAAILMKQVLSASYSEKGIETFGEFQEADIDCSTLKTKHENILTEHLTLANKTYKDLLPLKKADCSDDEFEKMVKMMYIVKINEKILTTGVTDDLAEAKQKMQDWFKNSRIIYPNSNQTSYQQSLNSVLGEKLNYFRRHFTLHSVCTREINQASTRLLALEQPELSNYLRNFQASDMTTFYIIGLNYKLFKDVLFHVHFAGAYLKTHYNSLTNEDIDLFHKDLALLKTAAIPAASGVLEDIDVVHLYDKFNGDSFQDHRSTLKKFFRFCINVLKKGHSDLFDPTRTPVIELVPVNYNVSKNYASQEGGAPAGSGGGGSAPLALENGGNDTAPEAAAGPDVDMTDVVNLQRKLEETQAELAKHEEEDGNATIENLQLQVNELTRQLDAANKRQKDPTGRGVSTTPASPARAGPTGGTGGLSPLPLIQGAASFARIFETNMRAHTSSPNFNSQKYFSGGLTTSRVAKLVPIAAERLKSDKVHMGECKRQVDSVKQAHAEHTRFAIGKFCRAKTAVQRASEPQLPLLTNSSDVLLNSLRVASSVASTREQFADLFI